MPYNGDGTLIPSKETACGTPLRTLQYPNGGCSYFYGNFLPETESERHERERAIAQVCGQIMVNRLQEESGG